MKSIAYAPPTPALAAAPKKSAARFLPHASRILLGLVFFVFGLNGFLNFIPPPPADAMPEFAVAMFKTGYMFPLVKGTEVIVGALLLARRYVPLALVVLAPIVVNILAFHAFLAPEGMIMSVVILGLFVHLLWHHRAAYRPLLAARA